MKLLKKEYCHQFIKLPGTIDPYFCEGLRRIRLTMPVNLKIISFVAVTHFKKEEAKLEWFTMK